MKFSEAMKALEDGKKIRGKDWDKSYYIHIVGKHLHTENGLITSVYTLYDWELYTEPKPKVMRAQYSYISAGSDYPSISHCLFASDAEFLHQYRNRRGFLWYSRLEERECES